jgi:CSLREA domain-containing protein/uncharacterized repeat protein (TIGR01451 family)
MVAVFSGPAFSAVITETHGRSDPRIFLSITPQDGENHLQTAQGQAATSTITVTTTDDDLAENGNCTLREAVQAANTDSAVDACMAGNGADVIYMTASTYPLTLSGAGEDNNSTGDLDISSNITFLGDHPNGWSAVYGDGLDRVFHITTGGITVTFQNIRISFGVVSGSGGGIFNESDAALFVHDSFIYQNGASVSGGGLYNQAGEVTISNTRIEGNYADPDPTSNGGGIDNRGLMNIVGSEILYNIAMGTGGGIFAGSGTLNILNTSILNNISYRGTDELGGGGITASNSILNIANSTIGFNQAYGSGGGIFTYSEVNLTHVALIGNVADDNQSGLGDGGGIFAGSIATVTSKNTLIAENLDGSPGAEKPDIAGDIQSDGYNLIGNQGMEMFVGGPGDLVGTSGSPVDPVLVTYAFWTPPYRLWAGSPAVEHIPPTSCKYLSNGTNPLYSNGANVTADQRGVGRPQGVNCDIGAYEAAAEVTLNKEVDSSGPAPGQMINYTILLENADALTGTMGVLSDTLPAELALAGTITLDPPAAGIVGSPPIIVTDLTLAPNAVVTVTIPAQVQVGVSGGTPITNTAEVTVSETLTPTQGSVRLVVSECQAQIDGSPTIYATVAAAVAAAVEGDLIKIAGYCAAAETQTGLAQLAILDKPLTLRGGYPFGFGSPPDPTAYPTTLDAVGTGRALFISSIIRLEDLIITGGRIYNTSGGGVYIQSGGVITMTRVVLMDNRTTGSSSFAGGAVVNGGQLLVEDSTFLNNFASGGGGAIYNVSSLILQDSTFNQNSAEFGGAIFNLSGAETTIQTSDFITNSASGNGGAINSGGILLIQESLLMNNTGENGGGIYNRSGGLLTIIGSSIIYNASSGDGGGVYLSNGSALTMTESTMAVNLTLGSGGGIYATTSTAFSTENRINVTNSTLSLNRSENGGGILVDGLGDPIAITLTHVTLTGNEAVTGISGGTVITGSGATLYLENTLAVGNLARGVPSDCAGAGMIFSQGYNLFGENTGCPITSTDLTVSPFIVFSQVVSADLLDNGGPTPTHALFANSPARDAVPLPGCLPTDQRGVVRPQGAGCDIGAFEYTPFLYLPIVRKN